MATRRGFLLGLGAFGAAAMAAPALVHAENIMKIVPVAPHLWADGVHDDALGLQWRLDHSMGIPDGNYRVERGLTIRPKTKNIIHDVHIAGNTGETPIITIEYGAEHYMGCVFVHQEGPIRYVPKLSARQFRGDGRNGLGRLAGTPGLTRSVHATWV